MPTELRCEQDVDGTWDVVLIEDGLKTFIDLGLPSLERAEVSAEDAAMILGSKLGPRIPTLKGRRWRLQPTNSGRDCSVET